MSKNLSIFFSIGLLFLSCKTNNLFQVRKYYGAGGVIFEFSSDNSFQYLEKMEGGYVYKFSKGTWKQERNKLFLINEVLPPDELPMSIRTSPSDESDAQLVINILPKKNQYFGYLPGTTDLLDIEMLIDNVTYTLKNEINIIHFKKPFGQAYFRAYPKPSAEKTSEMLNDTLRSKDILLKEFEGRIVMIDLDCNPYFFARSKMPNDTLQIVNDHKIKWGEIYLERPH